VDGMSKQQGGNVLGAAAMCFVFEVVVASAIYLIFW
jgi:hypothetical protein